MSFFYALKGGEIMLEIERGKIFYANLDPVMWHEQGGKRLVLILQDNPSLETCPTVLVVPITKRCNKKYDLPTHVYIKPSRYLKYHSVILLEHIREIDKIRIKQYLTTITKKDQKKVDKAIKSAFGISMGE